MATNLLSLIAQRDFAMNASGSGSFVVHCLLKPISLEVKTAQAEVKRTRQERMRKLFAREMEQERLQMMQLRLNKNVNSRRFRSTPLGLVPVGVRYVNKIPG